MNSDQSIQSRIRTMLIGLIWLWFVAYTLWLAPLDQPETFPIVQKLVTFQATGVNAYLFAIFWLMGVWPMIFACLMFIDCREQGMPGFLYFIAANATGVLGLVPYLLIRDRNQTSDAPKSKWIKILEEHRTGFVLSLITICVLGYVWLVGDWQDFVEQWRTIPFVHLITLDFCLMTLFFPLTSLLDDDMARRGLKRSPIFWAIALVPLFGPLAYLCFRPTLLNEKPFMLPTQPRSLHSISENHQ